MKITITRSFERTRQIADFVPIKAYCEATVELDQRPEDTTREEIATNLATFCESEVEKTLMGYTPACIRCGGKAIFPQKSLNKEGICGQCQSEQEMKAQKFKKKPSTE
jgi:hypothetical protein